MANLINVNGHQFGAIRGKEHLSKNTFVSVKNRLLSSIAQLTICPPKLRVLLHQLRGVKIGRNVFIGAGVIIDEAFPEKIEIGNDVSILARCIILSHSLYPNHFKKILKNVIGTTRLEKGCYLGSNVMVFPEVSIGEYSIIGAGSIVTRTIPSYSKAIGAPAKVVDRYSKKDIL